MKIIVYYRLFYTYVTDGSNGMYLNFFEFKLGDVRSFGTIFSQVLIIYYNCLTKVEVFFF